MKCTLSEAYFERMGRHLYETWKQIKALSQPDIKWGEWDVLPEEQRKDYIALAILSLPIHDFAGGNPALIPNLTLTGKSQYASNT